MKMPIYLDDLRNGTRTIAISHAGPIVRIVAIDRDGFDEESDISFVVADLSVALLRAALDQPETGAIPVVKAKAKRSWWRRAR